jgi:hypothetical protein
MSEINTTSINDLPTDPAAGGSIGGNISLVINEPVQNTVISPQGVQQNSQLTLDQSTISQIVNGLQQASLAGATQLPSRDIPLQTEQLTNDAQIQPNYIPQPSQQQRDYINDMNSDNINDYYRAEKNQNSLDSLYDELQAPLLLAVLYFLFQLPFFKKTVFKYLPFFCNSDGNYNFNGLIFTCALFGFIYYSLSKTVKNFSKF